jgi:[ribosomal protein S5]-alanine N-acetyltransferase
MMVELVTKRLCIRSLCATDYEGLLSIVSNPSVYRQVAIIPDHDQVAFSKQWLQRAKAAATQGLQAHEYIFGIFKATQPIGHCALHGDAEARQAELGYWLHPTFQGKGYALEACHALLRFAFVDLGLDNVHATCAYDNNASQHLLVKLGMMYQQELDVLTANGVKRRSRLYQLRRQVFFDLGIGQ